MRRFYLQRDTDLTGVSGTGRVADGIEFGDGTCVVHWRGVPSTTIWSGAEAMLRIHGHSGSTRVVWLDSDPA